MPLISAELSPEVVGNILELNNEVNQLVLNTNGSLVSITNAIH